MTSPHKSQTFPLPQTPPPHQDLSTLQLAIKDLSHRVTAPSPPLPLAPAPIPQPQLTARPPPPGKEKKGPKHPPPLLSTHVRILNTSSRISTLSLAGLSVIRSATHSFSPIHTKLVSSGEGPIT